MDLGLAIIWALLTAPIVLFVAASLLVVWVVRLVRRLFVVVLVDYEIELDEQ